MLEIEVKPPPRVRMTSHGSSGNLLFGIETESGEDSPAIASRSSGGGNFDPIYVKKSTLRRSSTSGGTSGSTENSQSPKKKKKATIKRAQTTPEYGRNGGSAGSRVRAAPDDFFCPITQEVRNRSLVSYVDNVWLCLWLYRFLSILDSFFVSS